MLCNKQQNKQEKTLSHCVGLYLTLLDYQTSYQVVYLS